MALRTGPSSKVTMVPPIVIPPSNANPSQYTAPIGPVRQSRGERAARAIGKVRDDLYGYKENEKTGKMSKSRVGKVNFFGGNPFNRMDPFGVGGTDAARSVRGGGHRKSRRHHDNDDY